MTEKPGARIVDPRDVPLRKGSGYPQIFKAAVEGRAKWALTDALGLSQFGVNITELAPGAQSALRHWHSHEDEFVYILAGTPTLLTNSGEQLLGPGMALGFPGGVEDGHCLVNRTEEGVLILEVGSRHDEDEGNYPDDDLKCLAGRYQNPRFVHKNGEPYE